MARVACAFWMLLMSISGVSIAAERDPDRQFWWAIHHEKELNPQWTGAAQAAVRWEHDFADAFHHHAQVGMIWEPYRSLKIGAHYRLVLKTDASRQAEHQPMLILSHERKWCDWSVAGRLRFDYKSLSDQKVARFRLKVGTPAVCGKRGEYKPYLLEELFWEVYGTYLEHRLIAGVELPSATTIALMLRERDRGSSELALRLDWSIK